MFRNEYDADITIFSPKGEIHQINYAKNASNKGNMMIGIKSSSHSLLVSFTEKLGIINKNTKILSISKNLGMVVSGIIGDGKYIHKFLEKSYREYTQSNNRYLLISWLVLNAKKIFSQNIFHSRTRPYGVSIVLGGFDSNGPQLFEISPDGIVQKFEKLITGSNDQFEIQILEENLNRFNENLPKFSIEELIYSFILGIRNSFSGKSKKYFFAKHLNMALVGKKTQWFILNTEIRNFFMKIFKKKRAKKKSSFKKIKLFKILDLKLNDFLKRGNRLVYVFPFNYVYLKIFLILKKKN